MMVSLVQVIASITAFSQSDRRISCQFFDGGDGDR